METLITNRQCIVFSVENANSTIIIDSKVNSGGTIYGEDAPVTSDKNNASKGGAALLGTAQYYDDNSTWTNIPRSTRSFTEEKVIFVSKLRG